MNKVGIGISAVREPLGFQYGVSTIGPEVEIRKLDAIRTVLRDPNAEGPEDVYAIAMDVYEKDDFEALEERNLLFGVVTYASGCIGKEPVRSQGHIHAVSASCGCSTPEVYEIWTGEAYIYMQESAKDNPGRCFAVHAKQGDVVIVPPNWAHATMSAKVNEQLTFGAWCVRDYGFDYDDVYAHKGLAWFPTVRENGVLEWHHNDSYLRTGGLIIKNPRPYDDFGIETEKPIYTQFQENPDCFLFVSNPAKKADLWEDFIP